MAYAFIGARPDHWCQLPDVPNASVETIKNYTIPRYAEILTFRFRTDTNGLNFTMLTFNRNSKSEFEQCERFQFFNNQNYTSDFSFVDYNHTVACKSMEFDQSIFHSTIVTEWDLVCGKEALASSVQAMYMLGILAGSPISGEINLSYNPH